MEKNSDIAVVKMDSVIGTISGKCLLTIQFMEHSLMSAFLRDANTSQSEIDNFDNLNNQQRAKQFNKFFLGVVTDNGSDSLIQRRLNAESLLLSAADF